MDNVNCFFWECFFPQENLNDQKGGQVGASIICERYSSMLEQLINLSFGFIFPLTLNMNYIITFIFIQLLLKK